MKKGLLGSTALIGATALMAGAAGAAEAPTWKLSGNMNFQIYFADRDGITKVADTTEILIGTTTTTHADTVDTTDLYFGVDEAELRLDVSGTADNGLNYGFKIELNANTSDGPAADEARIQLSGGWGTLQLGDEDGASDVMNYGGENLLGASGGWDGDGDDVATSIATAIFPSLIGDTSDATKISYFSPRFSGFQVGASYTPTTGSGDVTRGQDNLFQQNVEVGANYDNAFGGVRVRASAVFLSASYEGNAVIVEDISSWAVGGILGFGPFGVAASFADNGESGTLPADNREHSYWNVAAGWEIGPTYLSAGYIVHTYESNAPDFEPSAISITADYTVAPGLGVYAEWTAYDGDNAPAPGLDANVVILGINASF